MTAAALLRQADAALAGQDFPRAMALLSAAAEAQPGDAALLMKLAGVSRAAGQPRAALEAIHRALALAPLDFTALLMRASLLERIGDAGAGGPGAMRWRRSPMRSRRSSPPCWRRGSGAMRHGWMRARRG